MLIFCDFIQVIVFTTNHHLKLSVPNDYGKYRKTTEQLNYFVIKYISINNSGCEEF